MKRNALTLLSILVLLSVSSAAFATVPNPFTPAADCDGWSISGTMNYGTGNYANIDYWVKLVQGTDTLEVFSGSDIFYATEPDFLIEGMWTGELCGDYKAIGWFKFVGSDGWGIREFDIPFTCECDEPGGCTFTPGYWKNHPEAWPVMDLTVGCVDYTQAELLDIFDWPTRGDATIIMFHHLVAAKLNVLSGSADYITSAIMAGDDFLCMHPLGSKPKGDLKIDCNHIKNDLAAYNEIECEEDDTDDMLMIDGPAAMEKAAATEDASWGSIKKKHN